MQPKIVAARTIAAKFGSVTLAALLLVGTAASLSPVHAAEIKVMNSGGFSAPYKALVPGYEKATGDKLTIIWGPSMGKTPEAIPNRLARGEKADVLIMVGSALDNLIKEGKVAADSRTEVAKSYIGIAVKAGAPKPDISTTAAVKQALLNAKSIAYSDSASGVYLSTKLFPKLGIADQLKDKARMIPGTPVGEIVAHGEAELGFQQISELLPVPGIEVVGPLPADIQEMTLYLAGMTSNAEQPEAARRFLKYIASQVAAPIVKQAGLEPTTSTDWK